MSIGIRLIETLSANISITNNDVLANTGIAVNLAAGQSVSGRVVVFGNATTGGLRIQLVPTVALASIRGYCFLDDGSGAYVSQTLTAAPLENFIDPAVGPFTSIFDFFATAAAATVLNIQAAQAVADPSTMTVFSGSFVDYVIF